MNQQTIENTIAELKVWTKHNFDFHAPELGLLEEIGEFAHQLLKRGQKIRVTSDALRKDALADAVIFYFDLCWRYNHKPYDHPAPLRITIEWHLGALTTFAGRVLTTIADKQKPDTVHLISVWEHLNAIACLEGWDLEHLVSTTWNAVKVRDFRKFPGTGLPAEMTV